MRKPTLSCSACEAPMWAGKGAKTDGTQKCQPCRKSNRSEFKPCRDCGSEFKWSKESRCNPCRYERNKQLAIAAGRVCSECERPAIAKGLCSTHHAYQSRLKTGRKYQSYTKVCKFCSESFATTGAATEFCSLEHAQRHRNGWTSCTDLVARLKPRVWLGAKVAPRSGAALVAGQCSYCVVYFVGAAGSRYCSEKCSINASFKRKYDRKGWFSVSRKDRLAIYERDSWTCQLCEFPVDPLAPVNSHWSATLDHIVPQSHQLIPDHSPSNLRLSHMWCNAARGDGSNMSEAEFRRRVLVKFEEHSLAA
jgi:hypothetical protein